MAEKWKDTRWQIVWKGSDPVPYGVISQNQLPCNRWQYRYVISAQLVASAAISGAQEVSGTFTIHIGKCYKERVLMKWMNMNMFYPAAPVSIPGLGLVYWVIYYLDDKEVRTFYKWMKLDDLPEVYKDKVQKEQSLEMNFVVGENCAIEGDKLSSNLLAATAGVQNVAEGLLEGEKIVAESGEYKGLELTITANDGFGNAWLKLEGVQIINGKQITSIPNFSVGTALKCKVTHAWVEIGKKEKGKYIWYGTERYNFSGDSYFVMTNAPYGMYPEGMVVPLSGEWGSNIINVYLPTRAKIWLDEHTIGIPGLGKKGVAFWFRSILLPPLPVVRISRTCRNVFALLGDGDRCKLLRTYFYFENEWKEKGVVLNFLSGIPEHYDFLQFRDGRWYVLYDKDNWIKCVALSPEFEKFDCTRKSTKFWKASNGTMLNLYDFTSVENCGAVNVLKLKQGSEFRIFTNEDMECYIFVSGGSEYDAKSEDKSEFFEVSLGGKPSVSKLSGTKDTVSVSGWKWVQILPSRELLVLKDDGEVLLSRDFGRTWKSKTIKYDSNKIKDAEFVYYDLDGNVFFTGSVEGTYGLYDGIVKNYELDEIERVETSTGSTVALVRDDSVNRFAVLCSKDTVNLLYGNFSNWKRIEITDETGD
jgi:hypothetical protein